MATMIQVTMCPLCDHDRFQLFDQRRFRGHQVTNWLCLYCGLVFMSPRPSDDELGQFYAEQYRNTDQVRSQLNAGILGAEPARAAHLASIAQHVLPKVERHLDIGCSAGQLLLAINSTQGCESIGIEPSDLFRSYCLSHDLTVYTSLQELQWHDQKRFDLISLSHVLEHLSDPVEYLSVLRRDLLMPEGYLLVEVPNLYAHGCFELAHNFAFSADTLCQVMAKAGFNRIFLKKHGVPRSRIVPLYLTLVAQCAPDSLTMYQVRPGSRLIKFRRRLGLLLKDALWLAPVASMRARGLASRLLRKLGLKHRGAAKGVPPHVD